MKFPRKIIWVYLLWVVITDQWRKGVMVHSSGAIHIQMAGGSSLDIALLLYYHFFEFLRWKKFKLLGMVNKISVFEDLLWIFLFLELWIFEVLKFSEICENLFAVLWFLDLVQKIIFREKNVWKKKKLCTRQSAP